jgi:hypothetical protein
LVLDYGNSSIAPPLPFKHIAVNLHRFDAARVIGFGAGDFFWAKYVINMALLL